MAKGTRGCSITMHGMCLPACADAQFSEPEAIRRRRCAAEHPVPWRHSGVPPAMHGRPRGAALHSTAARHRRAPSERRRPAYRRGQFCVGRQSPHDAIALDLKHARVSRDSAQTQCPPASSRGPHPTPCWPRPACDGRRTPARKCPAHLVQASAKRPSARAPSGCGSRRRVPRANCRCPFAH